MFVFCGRLANFQEKRKKKTGDDLYKSLIIFQNSWLHTGKKRFWQNFTIFFSLLVIKNL
jgi:hypothetical protein